MFTFIYGGSASGKSDFAETLACTTTGPRIYLATMTATDEESLARIKKHKHARKDKGFHTIEQGQNLGHFPWTGGPISVILLECLGNLLANTLFANPLFQNPPPDTPSLQPSQVLTSLQEELHSLQQRCDHLIVVGNDVFQEPLPPHLDEFSKQYMYLLGALQKHCAFYGDRVIEMVYGIPIYHKGQQVHQEKSLL